MTAAYVALGTNLGDRLLNLAEARRQLRLLGALTEGLVFETRALRMPGDTAPQPDYLNTVDRLETGLGPLALLRQLQRIEALMGRRRTYRWGPRVIDLDLILHGAQTMRSAALTLPHPRAHQRDFVRWPLRFFGVELPGA